MFFLRSIFNLKEPVQNDVITVGPSQPILVGPQKQKVIVVGPNANVDFVITPQPRGAWDEQGWRRLRQGDRQMYEGNYRVAHRRTGHRYSFRGRVIVEDGNYLTYIADPPPDIKLHPKGPCFTADVPPWFHLHWHHSPKSVDDAILYMEKILSEVLNGDIRR